MGFLFRRPSRFRRALEAYGLGRCSQANGRLWIGFPPDPAAGFASVGSMPDAPRSICFVEGPEQDTLVAALAGSPEASTIEHLMIGTTHDYARRGRPTPYDFSATTAALAAARMPALKRLSLGDMEKLFNGHGYYGVVGDLTPVFDVAPNLESLDVCGRFTLARPVRHVRLESLTVDVDEIGISGGPLSQETIDALLSSRFPRLRALYLALDADEVQPYAVPDRFFADDGFPALEVLGIDQLQPAAEERIVAWASARGIRWAL
jgi:hypothetical protein